MAHGVPHTETLADRAAPRRAGNVVRLGQHTLAAPVIWLGHDLKSRLRVWSRVRNHSGILVSAHQVLMRNRCFLRKSGGRGLHRHLGYRGPIFLDSGGFHFQHGGRASIRVDDLLAAQEDLRPDLAAVLDLPLDPKASPRDNARRWRQTLVNTERMLRRGRPPLALVVHSYDIGQAERRCQSLRDLVPDPDVVCVGSLVPILRGLVGADPPAAGGRRRSSFHQRWSFIARLLQAVRAHFPNAFLHVFGAGTLSTILFLYLLGADSVDSVAWRLKAAYGAVRLPGLGDRYAADFVHTKTRRRLSRECWTRLRECRCWSCEGLKLSRRVSALAESFEARAVHNAQVFVDEIDAFRGAARAGRPLQFVYDRLTDNPRYRRVFTRTILAELGGGGRA
jgi:queuine/archaeosine tRNA-ribosyltransferase